MSYMESFETIVKDQLARVKRLAETSELTDYSKLDKIIIGTIDGDGIGEYANPSSISRAAVMMLRHIGYSEKAAQLEAALDKAQKALDLPGDGTGNTASDFTDFVTENL